MIKTVFQDIETEADLLTIMMPVALRVGDSVVVVLEGDARMAIVERVAWWVFDNESAPESVELSATIRFLVS